MALSIPTTRYRNVGDTLTIVQVTEAHVARSSTLGPEDVGTWCWIIRGCLMGFFPTREECQDRVDDLMSD